MKGVVIVVLAMVFMSAFMVHPSEAITCPDVDRCLRPCLAYLMSGGSPPRECCDGLEALKSAAVTKFDRQTACNCAKGAALITLRIREDTAEQLPGKCGITVSIPISPNVDCSTVSLYESYKSRAWKLFDGI